MGSLGVSGADYRGRLHERYRYSGDAFGETQVPQRALLAASILDQIRKPLNRNIHKGRLGHLGRIGAQGCLGNKARSTVSDARRSGRGDNLDIAESFRARSSDVDTVMVKALSSLSPSGKAWSLDDLPPGVSAVVVGCGLRPNGIAPQFESIIFQFTSCPGCRGFVLARGNRPGLPGEELYFDAPSRRGSPSSRRFSRCDRKQPLKRPATTCR